MTPGDERFAQSMADLSSRLGNRMAGRPPIDPVTALRNRQAALKAYDRARQQKYLMILGGVCCVVAAGVLAWGIVRFAAPERVAAAEPVSPPVTAIAQQEIAPAPVPVVAVNVPVVPESAPPPEVTTTELAPKAATPPALPRGDIAEAQRLLGSFGYNPGPADGAAGPRTQEAVRRYQEKHGLAQTGTIDQALLETLREDPAPKTVMTAQRSSQAPSAEPQYAQAQPAQRRTPSVFRPVEMAGQQITTWLSSVFR